VGTTGELDGVTTGAKVGLAVGGGGFKLGALVNFGMDVLLGSVVGIGAVGGADGTPVGFQMGALVGDTIGPVVDREVGAEVVS
jgi:hypothetical protein